MKTMAEIDMTRKRIIILGQFFSDNLGDRAIFESLKQIISEQGDYDIMKYPIKPVQFMTLKNRYSITWYLKAIKLLIIDIPAHYADLIKMVKQSNLVIIGGGNLIMDHSPLSPVQFLISSVIPKLMRKKLFICAIGAGPIRYRISKCLYRMALNLADAISVRDEYSLSVLSSADAINYRPDRIILTADPAFTMPMRLKRNPHGARVVGISTLAYQTPYHNNAGVEKSYNKYVQAMAVLVDQVIVTTNTRVKLIPTEAPYDVQAMEHIYEQIGEKSQVSLTYPGDVDELLDVICNCDVLIGTRMHSMILALSQNIPVIGLAWHGKINSLFNTMACPDLLFDIEMFQNDEIVEMLTEILIQREQYVEFFKNKVSNIQKRARVNSSIVRILLRSVDPKLRFSKDEIYF